MGLPEYDPVRLTIEGGDGLEGTQAGTELLDAETAGLWMAGKEFRRDQAVGDRVGKNEKTRVTCKLQQPGSGPPGREPAVSEDERKAMMAYYFKRQEELKKLAEVSNCQVFPGCFEAQYYAVNGLHSHLKYRICLSRAGDLKKIFNKCFNQRSDAENLRNIVSILLFCDFHPAHTVDNGYKHPHIVLPATDVLFLSICRPLVDHLSTP